MQNIDNIRPFKIRTDKLLYPINKDDKYKNSAIYLVTGSFEKSLKFLAKIKYLLIMLTLLATIWKKTSVLLFKNKV